MRIAVVGATGLTGRHTMTSIQRNGHEAVAIARAAGVDIQTGEGLAQALEGVDAVIDASNTPSRNADQAREFFGTGTDNLLAAEARTGVAHHVALSIVGVDRVEGNAHYAGKRLQEQRALEGPIPVTILRATQFHDFAAMVVGWTRRDGVATVAPLLVLRAGLGAPCRTVLKMTPRRRGGAGSQVAIARNSHATMANSATLSSVVSSWWLARLSKWAVSWSTKSSPLIGSPFVVGSIVDLNTNPAGYSVLAGRDFDGTRWESKPLRDLRLGEILEERGPGLTDAGHGPMPRSGS